MKMYLFTLVAADGSRVAVIKTSSLKLAIDYFKDSSLYFGRFVIKCGDEFAKEIYFN